MTKERVNVENYGCASNKFDLEIIIAYLKQAGCEITEDSTLTDIFLVNTCGVKKPTEDRILSRLRSMGNLNKPVLITGCLPKINLAAIEHAIPNYSAILDTNSLDRIPIILKNIEEGKSNSLFLSGKPQNKLELDRVRLNSFLEIVQVAEGCLGSCAFCCTRLARGRLFSYPRESIVDRVRMAVKEGVKEVWLTGQDVGAYGLDSGNSLWELLRVVCDVEGEFFVRVGMVNPEHAKKILDLLVEVYEDGKIFKFLHLPLQSGNDEVLKLMRRPYTVNDFLDIVSKFRRKFPEVTLATDVICGFPGESEEAFEDSLKVIVEVKPDVVNVSKFSPRPKTFAKKMKQLPSQVIKARSRRMTSLCRKVSFERNERWLNWVGEVLVDEKGKDDSWVGRNFAYKPTVVHDKENLLGRKIKTHVTNVSTTYLLGERLT